jgi:hypothetical protein
MSGPIGTLGNIPTITVAGRVFTDLTNLKILQGAASGVVYSVLYDASPGVTPGVYQVPGATVFNMHALDLVLHQASGGSPQATGLFTGTTNLGDNAAGPLITPKGLITGAVGVASAGDLFGGDTYGSGPSRMPRALGGQAAASTYIHLYNNAAIATSITVYGYEVP